MIKRLFIVVFCFSFFLMQAQSQLLEKESNRYRLKKGISLANEVNTKNLTKVTPTVFINSGIIQESNLITQQKRKPKKPVKLSKYSIRSKSDE